MKIFEIISTLSSGGAERLVVELCNGLAETDDVTLIVLFRLEGDYSFHVPFLSTKVKLLSMNKGLGFSPLIALQLAKIIKNEKPDIVHAHMDAQNYILIPSLCQRKTKYVVTVHNDAEKASGGKFVAPIRRFMYKRLVTPVTISNESRRSYVEFFNLPEPEMIINGRDIKSFPPCQSVVDEVEKLKKSKNTIVVCSVARFAEQKRPWILASVGKKLYEEGYDIVVLFIGSLTNKSIESRVRQISSDCIKILGERVNPVDYMRVSDCMTLFSGYEGMPIALVEALGVGCVPIFTPVGGVKDAIISGINGLLCDDLSEESCYSTLKYFLDLPKEKRIFMAESAKRSFAPYSMDTCINKYRELFRRIV